MPKNRKNKRQSPSHKRNRAGRRINQNFIKKDSNLWISKKGKPTHLTQHLSKEKKIITSEKPKNWSIKKDLKSRKKKDLKKTDAFVKNLLTQLDSNPNHCYQKKNKKA